MTTAQIDEIWHAHCATTDAAIDMAKARTKEARDEACAAYRAAERRFYVAWQVAAKEAEPGWTPPVPPPSGTDPVDPVAESQDRETVEVVGR